MLLAALSAARPSRVRRGCGCDEAREPQPARAALARAGYLSRLGEKNGGSASRRFSRACGAAFAYDERSAEAVDAAVGADAGNAPVVIHLEASANTTFKWEILVVGI